MAHDPLESVIAEAMSNGNDIQPFEVAEAVRNSPEAIASLAPYADIDSYLAQVQETTTFGVNLAVRLPDDQIEVVGSPIDWDWYGVVSKYIGDIGGAFDVSVRSVAIESKSFVNHDGDVVLETTYSVGEKQANISKDILDNTLIAFSEGVVWNDEQRSAYTDLAEAMGVKAPVEGDEHYE